MKWKRRASRLHNLLSSSGIKYLLFDTFHEDLAAGSVDGTYPLVGPARQVTDTGSNLSISDGNAVFDGGPTTHGDPGVWYGPIEFAPGNFMISEVSTHGNINFGWDANTASVPSIYINPLTASNFRIVPPLISGSFVPVGSAPWTFCVALGNGQQYHLIHDGDEWKLAFVSSSAAEPTYVAIASWNAVVNVPYIVVPQARWTPTPLLADTFSDIPVAVDSGVTGCDGLYDNVGLSGSGSGASFLQSSSKIDLYNPEFLDLFDGNEGTIIFRFRMPTTETWTAHGTKYLFRIQGSSANGIIRSYITGAGVVVVQRSASGVAQNVSLPGAQTSTDWLTIALTWSVSSDLVASYSDGTMVTSKVGLADFVDTIHSNTCTIGGSVGVYGCRGYLQDFILASNPGSSADIAALHAAMDSSLDSVLLSSIFGAGNYMWLPLDEFYTSDGGNHDGIESGGGGVAYEHSLTWANDGNGGRYNTPSLGNELLSDSDMESDDGSWVDYGTPTYHDQSSDQAHGGTYSRYISTSAAEGAQQDVSGLAAGWHELSVWVYPTSGTGILRVISALGWHASVQANSGGSNAWEKLTITGRYTNGTARVYVRGLSSADFYYDDASVKALSISDLLDLVDYSRTDIYAEANWQAQPGTQHGFAMLVDDASNPQNFVLVHCDGTNIMIEQCIAGAYTTLANVNTTYDPSARFIVRMLFIDGGGIEVYVAYGAVGFEAKVASVTVTDAALISNTLHGLFSTHENNRATHVNIYASTGYDVLDRWIPV